MMRLTRFHLISSGGMLPKLSIIPKSMSVPPSARYASTSKLCLISFCAISLPSLERYIVAPPRPPWAYRAPTNGHLDLGSSVAGWLWQVQLNRLEKLSDRKGYLHRRILATSTRIVGYRCWQRRCSRSILTVPTHLPLTSSNIAYSLAVLRVLTLSSRRRIWASLVVTVPSWTPALSREGARQECETTRVVV